MITNLAPRPWYPGQPVSLAMLSTDGEKPTDWGSAPIANGSKLNVIDKNARYIFDAQNRCWYPDTSGGGGGGAFDASTDADMEAFERDLFGDPETEAN